ncbi:MAG: response regulator transcription factor [Bacteroidetes bacterium]|nr:response regulator transcription factor [Bacteroidota bacterium]
MKCIVVDDNKLARTALKHLISQVNFLSLLHECENSTEAFNILKSEEVDLVFLDIEMPEMTGIELIRNLEKKPIIVLITAKSDYAVEAFELNVADYLVKPVTLPRFMAAVSRAKELYDSREGKIEASDKDDGFIFVRNKGILNKIDVSDIHYLQALGDYVNIYTSEKKFTIHVTLSGIEKKLSPGKFFRVHRSYIVALSHIDHIEGETLYINHHPVPIGEQYRQALLRKINFI